MRFKSNSQRAAVMIRLNHIKSQQNYTTIKEVENMKFKGIKEAEHYAKKLKIRPRYLIVEKEKSGDISIAQVI